MAQPKILIIDTETAAHQADVWQLFDVNVGLSQIRKPGHLLCFSAAWADRPDEEIIFDAEWHTSHKHMVKHLHALYEDADFIVTFNGVKFDNKVANTEFVLAGLPPPPPYKNIDLYQVVKKRFRFASSKLDWVASQLGLGNKLSHPGHSLWRQCELGDKEAQTLMGDYNRQDVVLTKRLYERLLPWLTVSPAIGNFEDKGHVCPNCGNDQVQQRGYARNATSRYVRYQCVGPNGCGTWSRGGTPEHKHTERRHILRAI